MRKSFLRKFTVFLLLSSCICNTITIRGYASTYSEETNEDISTESQDFQDHVDIISELPSSKNINDMYGQAGKQYDIESIYDVQAIEKKMKEKAISNIATSSNATLESQFIVNTHEVKIEPQFDDFIDAIYSEGGIFTNVSAIADWESDNPDIVSVNQGRLLTTEREGEANITVKYQGKTETIHVEVRALSRGKRRVKRFPKPILAANRQQALDRALAMIEFTWTTTKDLSVWQDKQGVPAKVYPKGTTVHGIIYTQSEYQRGLEEFKEDLKRPDFYSKYIGEFTESKANRTMPMYGNDCSGFVSIAWGIERTGTATFIEGMKKGRFKKVGNYNSSSPSSTALLAAYKVMQPGDALVKEGHIMLVASVDALGQSVTVYEQTPYHAIISKKSFSSLLKSSYCPITIFASGSSESQKPHWQKEGDKWYYYGSDGTKMKGWQKIDEQWYYMDTNGVMLTGWQKISGVNYYLHSDGRMAHSEWIQSKEDTMWYYLHGDGKMASHEWITTKGISYYVHGNGHMATNEWIQWTDGNWYYLTSDGSMAKNRTLVLKGISYQFDENGKCLNPNG